MEINCSPRKTLRRPWPSTILFWLCQTNRFKLQGCQQKRFCQKVFPTASLRNFPPQKKQENVTFCSFLRFSKIYIKPPFSTDACFCFFFTSSLSPSDSLSLYIHLSLTHFFFLSLSLLLYLSLSCFLTVCLPFCSDLSWTNHTSYCNLNSDWMSNAYLTTHPLKIIMKLFPWPYLLSAYVVE